MKIDLAAVGAGQVSYADLTRNLQKSDIDSSTGELFDDIDAILADATDATILFVPRDAAASDQDEQGWSINHIVTHLTASLEESAAISTMLARGVKPEGRLRYETPWQELTTVQHVRARLQESRRMYRSFLDAWPDAPHLEIIITPVPQLGPMNAIGLYAIGLAHGQGHLDQLREVVRQYRASVGV